MNSERVLLRLTIGSANLVGVCAKCDQPTTGSYDSDRPHELTMKCVDSGCGWKATAGEEESLIAFFTSLIAHPRTQAKSERTRV